MSILKVANIHFETAGTNRIDYLGDDKVRITSANGTVLSGATNDALLRITQTGTGDVIRIEDETNPDATPFVVDANGNIGIGTNSINPVEWNTANTRVLKIRAAAANDYATIQLDNIDGTGRIWLSSNAGSSDEKTYVWADDNAPLSIRAGREIAFSTDVGYNERMRISNTGNVLIGRADSTVGLGVKLDVNGAINCSNILVNGAAVSGGASITVTDQSSVNPLQYLTFTTTTSGTASSLNVATTKLTFNVATGTLSSTVFNSTSDINQKENITLVTNSLDIIEELNGVRFTWKDNGLPSLGVIAQEVEKVLPELVSDEKSVNYNGLIAVLIEAVKELKAEIEVLKSR